MKSTSRNKAQTFAPSLLPAAVRLGLPPDLLKIAKRAGCKAFRADGRVHLEECEEWIEAHKHELPEADALVSEFTWRARDKKAIAEIREHKLALARRDVIPVNEVRITLTRAIVEARKQFMEGMRTSMQEAALHCNGDEKQIAWCMAQGEKRARDILTDLSKTEFADLDCPHCAKEIKP